MDLLKFVALDAEDLEVVSAHLQDAVVKTSEVLWRPHEQRVVVALNRFDWEGAQAETPEFRRRRAAFNSRSAWKTKVLCSALWPLRSMSRPWPAWFFDRYSWAWPTYTGAPGTVEKTVSASVVVAPEAFL